MSCSLFKTGAVLLMCALTSWLYANNIQISNVALSNDSTLAFNVSWENSWRVSVAPNNHDAVWVFIKRKDCASGQWSHVDLSPLQSNHSVGSPLEIYIDGKDAGPSAKGLFIRRRADGSGSLSNVSVSIRMESLPAGQFDFRVFGVEMVQVPQGSFQLGDGNASLGSFKQGNTNNPYTVVSENSISAGSASTSLYTSSTSYRTVSLPANYPKGFDEVYCMKHEISQGQYADFVNTLTSDQASNRQVTGTVFRLNITGSWPVLLANTPHRAMNYMAWSDLLAYLDWSALRPMTELEYEKICRGPAAAVAREFAWGSGIITDANNLINNGTANEIATNPIAAGGGIANYNNNVILGPLRCGFAAKSATSRQEAGAGYYGAMELSGNLWEATISTRNNVGAAFVGNVGDGALSASPNAGFANQASWPNQQASQSSYTSAPGKVLRGASWNEPVDQLRVSDRSQCNVNSGQRFNEYGGRGVR
jgi:formylglycine-generating enzyme required for sulfatase activity